MLPFNHSSLKEHFDCFQFLSIIDKASVNICVQVILDVSSRFFGTHTQDVIAGTYGKCMFNFLKKLPNCFAEGTS